MFIRAERVELSRLAVVLPVRELELEALVVELSSAELVRVDSASADTDAAAWACWAAYS